MPVTASCASSRIGADADRPIVADSNSQYRSLGADLDRSIVADSNFIDITVFAKNARLSSDERLLTLTSELESIYWDVILFSEPRAPSGDYFIAGSHRLLLRFDHDVIATFVHAQHVDVKAIHRNHDRLLADYLRFGSSFFIFCARRVRA